MPGFGLQPSGFGKTSPKICENCNIGDRFGLAEAR
jgi:hypothetical protein